MKVFVKLKLFSCVLATCTTSTYSSCTDHSSFDCAIANLVTVYNNKKYMQDCVQSLRLNCNQLSRHFPSAQIFSLFRIDYRTDDKQQEDHDSLDQALSIFPLPNSKILMEREHLGCSNNRKKLLFEDLKELMESNPYLKSAASTNKLYFRFVDSDDIDHPDLLRIMLHHAIALNSFVICAEYTTCKFDKYSISVLNNGRIRYNYDDFETVRIPNDRKHCLNYTPDGMRIFQPEAPFSMGYLPTLFKYDQHFIQTWQILDFDTMSPLVDSIEDNKFLIVPRTTGINALSFYRQHPDSALHCLEEEYDFEEIIEEYNKDRKGLGEILAECGYKRVERHLQDLVGEILTLQSQFSELKSPLLEKIRALEPERLHRLEQLNLEDIVRMHTQDSDSLVRYLAAYDYEIVERRLQALEEQQPILMSQFSDFKNSLLEKVRDLEAERLHRLEQLNLENIVRMHTQDSDSLVMYLAECGYKRVERHLQASEKQYTNSTKEFIALVKPLLEDVKAALEAKRQLVAPGETTATILANWDVS